MSGLRPENVNRRRDPQEDAALWERFRGASGESVRSGAAAWLKRPMSVKPAFDFSALVAVFPPDDLRGEALLRGVWRTGLERIELGMEERPWARDATLHFRDRIHRFDWLADLAAQGEAGRELGRWLVDAWIEDFGAFDGFAWRLGPTADRVWNWLLSASLLFGPSQGRAGSERLQNLHRQTVHIAALCDQASDVEARFRSLVVLAAMPALAGDGVTADEALDRLEAECTAQILPDGGHVSRSPQRLLNVMSDLISLRGLLSGKGLRVPDFFDRWLARMGSMLNFLRCDDGALFAFNDSGEARPEQVDAVLSALESAPRRFSFSPKSGFQKLQRASVQLLLDVGAGPEQPFGDLAHAGALGFELADGPARIVTSCGFSREVNVDWQAAVRRTGAHSTLVLGGRDSAAFVRNPVSRMLCPVGPDGISARRLEEADEIWLEAQHSGYRESFGLLHRRRLFLAADGARLTGEDSLVRPVSCPPEDAPQEIGFEIRFHLHPGCEAMMGLEAISLVCANGARWLFKTSHAGARLEASIYLSRGTVERNQQIVLSGQADSNGDGSGPPNCVRWAFIRERAA